MSTLNIQLLCRILKKQDRNYRYLLHHLAPWLTLCGSKYPCLERFSMVPKMFERLKFDCMLCLFSYFFVLISLSFGVSGGLCFVIEAFPGYLH